MASGVQPTEIGPMHFGTFPLLRGTPAELKKALAARGVEARVTELKVGETRAF
jgi:L-ascorbate metabolism protein UlaG (beta-lactamase superfamily)